MAEKISISPEIPSAEQRPEGEHQTEKLRGTAEVESQKQKSERIEHLRGQIEHEAKTETEALKPFELKKIEKTKDLPPPPSKELRGSTLNRELKEVRRKLSFPDKVGSKIIHNPVVRGVSEISSKTISRPSGLLGGGIVAFLGTGAYYYLTVHIGLKYNYLVFVILFVGGFIIGLAIELGIYTLSSKKSIK